VPKVHFLNEDVEAEARPGESIKDVADRVGIPLVRGLIPRLHCHGHGLCGRCRVWAMPGAAGGVSPLTLFERLRFYRGSRRLACQAKVLGDVEVRTTPNAAPPAQTTVWPESTRPTKWKERAAAAAAAEAAKAAADKAAAEAAARAAAEAPKPALDLGAKPAGAGANAAAEGSPPAGSPGDSTSGPAPTGGSGPVGPQGT
jgi:ferredoxin